ncbi:DMT family transporter [Crocinitomix catalasitica]|uniref:DMT family transporter n=1 Tax=Crocinitomix catalasitica TaxID=184607 RepID=UPI000486C24C|nr:DMT family transporter [Crocinitomix catalasitica]
MFNLILGILFFVIVLVLFKLFDRNKVDILQAIVTNYLVAGTIGYISSNNQLSIDEIFVLPWLPLASLIGILFILVFNFLAFSTQKNGFAISTIANKMSVILPVIASIYLYNESLTWLKSIGVLLALVGIVFSSLSKNKELSFEKKYLSIILVIFIGQGISDIIFNYVQHHYIDENTAPFFISTIFLTAFIFGLIYLMTLAIMGKTKLRIKNVAWGIAVGIPNYLTVFYFFKALEENFLESSQIYPILNIGIILISTMIGLIFFKEKLSKLNWIGIIVSMVAIALIGLS